MTESGVEHPEIVSDGEKPEDELATTGQSLSWKGSAYWFDGETATRRGSAVHLMRQASDLPRYTAVSD